MNVKLLTEVRDKILAEPEHFVMDTWHSECETTHCIGGWAQILTKGEESYRSTYDDATEILMLTKDQSARIFLHSNWPEYFYQAYKNALTSADRARIAAERIDHFIKTEGKE